MTKFLVFLIAGVLALVSRDLLFFTFPIGGHAPDLVLVVVLYLGIFRNPVRGLLIAFVLGYVVDLTSGGGYAGLSSLVYLALFLFARLIGRVFYGRNVLIQSIMAVVGTAVYAYSVHAILHEFGVLGTFSPGDPGRIAIQAAYNGAVAPFVFALLFRLESLVSHLDGADPAGERRRTDAPGWVR